MKVKRIGNRYDWHGDQAERFPLLATGKCSLDEAKIAIRKLSRHFKLTEPTILTHPHRCTVRGGHQIFLTISGLTWLNVLRAYAHIYHLQKYREAGKIQWHGRLHWRLVLRCAKYAIKKGWHAGTIEGTLIQKNETAEQQRQRLELKKKEEEANRPVIQQKPKPTKIDLKKLQIKRLERKVKMLTTRLKGARRSLAALERHEAKKQATQANQTQQMT